jgi:hypothetical protein
MLTRAQDTALPGIGPGDPGGRPRTGHRSAVRGQPRRRTEIVECTSGAWLPVSCP